MICIADSGAYPLTPSTGSPTNPTAMSNGLKITFAFSSSWIIFNTGLVMRAATPNQLIGVLAHETGHIAGGHLTRFQEAARNASIEGIIAMVLAAAATVAGRGSGGGGALLGAQGVAERAFMQYSITQEASADRRHASTASTRWLRSTFSAVS